METNVITKNDYRIRVKGNIQKKKKRKKNKTIPQIKNIDFIIHILLFS